MDNEKSRAFYLERYYRALEKFGERSLTARICQQKLALLGTRVSTPGHSQKHAADNEADIKSGKTGSKSGEKS